MLSREKEIREALTYKINIYRKKTEKDRKKDGKNKNADFLTHQNGIQITNAQDSVCPSCKKQAFSRLRMFEKRRQQERKKITDLKETK